MKKKVLASLAVICATFGSYNAAFADANATGRSTNSSTSSNTYSGSSTGSASGSNPAAMAAGVVAGFALGWPVCLARRFKHDEVQGTRGIAGETDNPILLGTAGAVWLPFAVFTSFFEAPVYALRNSYMADKPFSKDQFSLGDMPDYD